MVPMNIMRSMRRKKSRNRKTYRKNPRKIIKRSLHYSALNKVDSGAAIGEIKNDRKHNESLAAYKRRSFLEFAQRLKPNQFYLYTDRSSLKNGVLVPGHIVSFLTNDDGGIIDHSWVSLRRQKERKKDVALKFRLFHDDSKQRL